MRYFVNSSDGVPPGNDTNNGDETQPFKTLAHALAVENTDVVVLFSKYVPHNAGVWPGITFYLEK